jgi:hypothetical protein
VRSRLEEVRPSTLLLIFMLSVPVLVAVAGLAAVVLIRAGYGTLIGLVVPSLALSAATVVLGVSLGRAASRRAQKDAQKGGRGERG